MGNWLALLSAIAANTVSLWSGIFGILATIGGLIFRKAPSGKLFIAAGMVALLLSPSLAWIDEHKLRVKLEQVRPYIVIEEVSPDQIRTAAQRDPRKSIPPESVYGRGYIVGQSPQHDLLLYNVRNAGNIPARRVLLFPKVTAVNENSEEVIPIVPPTGGAKVYLPGQFALYSASVPRGTFFTGLPNERRKIRIELVATYSGQASDKNVYFYKVVLLARRFADVTDMNKSFGGISVDSTDEGIVSE
jgi:hypothetical protein